MNADVVLALAFQVLLFQFPRILEIAHKRLGKKIIQRLVIAAGRRIIRGGHMHMVTKIGRAHV